MIRFTSNKDAVAAKPVETGKGADSDQPSDAAVKSKTGKKLRKASADASQNDEGSNKLL